MRQDTTPSVAVTRLRFEGGHSKPKLPVRIHHTSDANHNDAAYKNTDYCDPTLKYLCDDQDVHCMQSDNSKLANGDLPKSELDSGSGTPDGSSGVGTLVKQSDLNGTTRSITSTDLSRSNLSYRQRWDQSRRGTQTNHDICVPTTPKYSSQPTLDLADPMRSMYAPQMSYDSNYSVFSLPHTFDAPKVVSPSHAFNSTPQLWDRSVNRSAVSVPATNASLPLQQTESDETQPVATSRERIGSLAFLSLLSLILAVASLQLLFCVAQNDSSSAATYVREVCIAVASFAVMLCFSCVMVCALQTMCALKLLRCEGGQQRSIQYLQDCAATRFIAITAFFMAIPVFLLALLLYTLVELKATTSIICTVIMAIGIVFTFTTAIHNVYCWRVEKMNADWVMPVTKGNEKKPRRIGDMNQSELSTLV